MWEALEENTTNNMGIQSARLKVPGGWIVRTIAAKWQNGNGVAQTFVADPEHEWDITVES